MNEAIRRLIQVTLVVLFAAAIGAFMLTFTVPFNKVAVKTTFGNASDETDVIDEPGLYLKWPYPIQSVTSYDHRLRVVQTRSEQVQTQDNLQIVVEAYCTYRVSNPLVFFQKFSNAGRRPADHFRAAERDVLTGSLRSALGEVSRYELGELFGGNASGLSRLEDDMLSVLTAARGGEGTEAAPAGGGQSMAEFGIEVTSVGIQRIVLPQTTSQAVMERMSASRDRLANALTAEGEANAANIRAQADEAREKILAFARARAAEIRAQGESEAAYWLARMDSDQATGLAEYLQTLETMRSVFNAETDNGVRGATMVLSSETPGLSLLDPATMQRRERGTIPEIGVAPRSDDGDDTSAGASAEDE